jgi:hypothetical protein
MAVNCAFFCWQSVDELLIMGNNSPADSVDQLRHVHGEDCIGVSSGWHWIKHCKDGNTDTGNWPCIDQPRTATTECNKQKVDALVKDDQRVMQKSRHLFKLDVRSAGDAIDFTTPESLLLLCSCLLMERHKRTRISVASQLAERLVTERDHFLLNITNV